MENKNNYAVDLGTDKDTVRELIILFTKIAHKYKWRGLGNLGLKRYFRFGYADESSDAGEGFYFWTADFIKDKDYAFVTIDKAIQLLSTIDKSLDKEILFGGHKCKIDKLATQIGCMRVVNSDLTLLQLLMKNYHFDKIVVYKDNDPSVIKYDDLVRLNNIIKKKG